MSSQSNQASQPDRWSQVDKYITASVVQPDEALDKAVAATDAAGMPAIAVSAPQGKFLHLLARMIGARRILEIGTLGGYSTIWLARALPPGGQVVTLELSEKHAAIARGNLAAAGVEGQVTIRTGPALDTLPKLQAEGQFSFDLTFIDADKANIPQYFDWALKLSHPGGVIIVDNVVRDGRLLDADSSGSAESAGGARGADSARGHSARSATPTDPSVAGVRRLHEVISRMDAVSATTIQTVGAKGYDGFTLAVIN